MALHVVLLQWLDEVERYPWSYYLRACAPVDNLRQFIEQWLPWYIQMMEYRIQGTELQSLLKVVALTGEDNWKVILSIRDLEARIKAIRVAAE